MEDQLIDADEIHKDSLLLNDLKMDSIMMMDFSLRLEEVFGIDIRDCEIEKLKKMDDVYKLVRELSKTCEH